MNVDFKNQETEKELNYLLGLGFEQVSLPEMEAMLNEIGLRLDWDRYPMFYWNTSNPQPYNVVTTSPIDEGGVSAFNVNGKFYQKEVLHKTEKYFRLKELRNHYVCVVKKKNLNYILSF